MLLADDYPEILNAVSRLLALECEIVGTVADGSALLETAQRLKPDVIVLDVNLPNVRSLEACREITRLNPEIKVIMFTVCLRLETGVRRPAVDHQAVVRPAKLTPRLGLSNVASRAPVDPPGQAREGRIRFCERLGRIALRPR